VATVATADAENEHGVPRWSPTCPAQPDAGSIASPPADPRPCVQREDSDFTRAILESLREADRQQEHVAAQPGAYMEAGMIVPPDVGVAQPLSALAGEYAQSPCGPLWTAKVQALGRTYQSMRRVRGDGNCFYRSMWMGWMERALCLSDAQREAVWREQLPRAASALQPHLPTESHAEFEQLTISCARTTRELFEDGAGTMGLPCGGSATTKLEALVQRSDETSRIMRWLRLLTSAYMRSHKETFQHILTDGMNLDGFCVAEVERMGVEADEPQIQALASALDIRVRVEYLDAKAVPWSKRCGPHRHVVCGAPERMLAACLLFRPGHYDMLTPRDWTAVSQQTDTAAHFVPPLPPGDVKPYSYCSDCLKRVKWLCWLCAQPTCASLGCPRRGAVYDVPPAFSAPSDRGAICTGCMTLCPSAVGMQPQAGPRSLVLQRCSEGCTRVDFADAMEAHLANCQLASKARTMPEQRCACSSSMDSECAQHSVASTDGDNQSSLGVNSKGTECDRVPTDSNDHTGTFQLGHQTEQNQLDRLLEMGFDAHVAADALDRARGDLGSAISALMGCDDRQEPDQLGVAELRDHQIDLLVSYYGVTRERANRALNRAAVPSFRQQFGQSDLEVASALLFEEKSLDRHSVHTSGVYNSWRLSDSKPVHVNVPFECECGFNCGTEGAWQRHVDRRSCVNAKLVTKGARCAMEQTTQKQFGA